MILIVNICEVNESPLTEVTPSAWQGCRGIWNIPLEHEAQNCPLAKQSYRKVGTRK
jgi:hypothetical protein